MARRGIKKVCAAVAPPEGSRPLCGCRGGGRWWVGCSCPAAPAAPRPGPPPRVPPAPGRAAARPVGGPPGRCPLAAWPLARPLAALPPPGWPSSLLASRPQASCLLAVSGPLRAWVRAGARVPPSRRCCSVVGSGLAAAPPPPGGAQGAPGARPSWARRAPPAWLTSVRPTLTKARCNLSTSGVSYGHTTSYRKVVLTSFRGAESTRLVLVVIFASRHPCQGWRRFFVDRLQHYDILDSAKIAARLHPSPAVIAPTITPGGGCPFG